MKIQEIVKSCVGDVVPTQDLTTALVVADNTTSVISDHQSTLM